MSMQNKKRYEAVDPTASLSTVSIISPARTCDVTGPDSNMFKIIGIRTTSNFYLYNFTYNIL